MDGKIGFMSGRVIWINQSWFTIVVAMSVFSFAVGVGHVWPNAAYAFLGLGLLLQVGTWWRRGRRSTVRSGTPMNMGFVPEDLQRLRALAAKHSRPRYPAALDLAGRRGEASIEHSESWNQPLVRVSTAGLKPDEQDASALHEIGHARGYIGVLPSSVVLIVSIAIVLFAARFDWPWWLLGASWAFAIVAVLWLDEIRCDLFARRIQGTGVHMAAALRNAQSAGGQGCGLVLLRLITHPPNWLRLRLLTAR